MKCKEVKENLNSYYGRELSPELFTEISKHLSFCIDCKNELSSIESALKNLKLLKIEYLPEKIDVWNSIKDKLTPQPKQLTFKFKKAIIPMSAVAMLLIGFFVGYFLSFSKKSIELIDKTDEKPSTTQSVNAKDLSKELHSLIEDIQRGGIIENIKTENHYFWYSHPKIENVKSSKFERRGF